MLGDSVKLTCCDKPRHGQKPVLAQQRLELVDDNDEGNEINQRQAALKNQPRQPIVIAVKQLLEQMHGSAGPP